MSRGANPRTGAGKLSGHTGRAEPTEPPAPSQRCLRGLDWFVFCVADVQTGFGPFVAVYLTTQKWTQVDIGLVLTWPVWWALAGQVPGGALVDAVRSERRVAGLAITAIAVSRPHLRSLADFSGGARGRDPSCRGELRAGSGHCRHQPWACGPRRRRRTARTKRALSLHRQRPCRRHRWARAAISFRRASVFIVTALLLVPTLLALRCIAPQRNQSRAGPWRLAAANRKKIAGRVSEPAAQPAAADVRRLHHAVPSRQCRHASADGNRR